MGSNGDDTNSPDAAVSVEIGGTGIAIFGFLLFLIALSLITAKNKYSRLLFISSAIMSILEIPRYVALVVDRAYTCQTTYMFHLIGSVFFFLSFSFVCYLLHDAVDMSHATTPLLNTMQPAGLAEKMIFDKQVLILMNGVFAALAVTTCIVCLLYSSLYAFFEESRLFFLFTIVDATKNIMFGGTVIYYGQRLRERIMRFASNSAGFESPSEAALIIKLRTAVRKLLVVMVICNFCFWLRVAMLILKLVLVERNDDRISSLPWLPPYGLLWWWLDDFLPRALPIYLLVIFFSKTKAAQKTDSVSKSGSSLDRFRRNFVHIDDTDSNSQPGRDNSDEDSFRHAYAGGEAEVNGAGDRENQTKSAHTSFSLNAFLAGLLRGRTRSGEASTEEKDQLRQRLLNENDSIINSSRNAATAAGVSTPSSSGTGASPDGANTNRGVGSTGRKNAGGDLNQSMESQATRYAVQGTPMQPAAVHGDHDAHFTTPRSRQYSGNRGRYPFAYQTLPVDECGGAENEPVGRSDSADREDIEQSFGFDVFSYRSSTTDGGQSMYTDAAASAIYSGGSGTGQLSGARSTAHNNVTDRNGHTSQYDSNRGAWSHTHRNQADARGVSFGGESSTQSVVIAKNVLQWSTPTGAGGQQHIVDMSDTESDV